MPSNVYYHPVQPGTPIEAVQQVSRRLLERLVQEENITLGQMTPLKVHFGEKGNVTFLRPENFDGVIDYLAEKGTASCFMETCVLYGGQRYKKELHEQTARAHGFTRLPVVFADGEHGEDYAEVEIGQKHFQRFKVGRAFLEHDRLIVLSHFKGHRLAGFGGAIKQLSMGFAAKGGKLAMHMGEKPVLKARKCKQCMRCLTCCQAGALTIGKKSRLDQEKCYGCGACMAICPHKAITIITVKGVLKFLGLGNPFIEKVVEGAYAAQLGKRHLYLNFVLNITAGCDCEGRRMKPVLPDIGIFASTDPVAIDKACWDMAAARGRKFRGAKTFAYAERIGLGTAAYTLREGL